MYGGWETSNERMSASFQLFGRRMGVLATVVLGLLGPARGSLLQAQVSAAQPALSAQSQELVLEYRELDTPIVSQSVSISSRAEPFAKEPPLSGRKVRRGVVHCGDDASQNLGFLWDYTKSRLYLDLNRNQDLTDDPSGVVACSFPFFSASSQSFNDLHLSVNTSGGTRPLAGDLCLYFYGGNLSGIWVARSIWDGKVSLQGREWQLGLVPGTGRDENRYLVLRPWVLRKQPLQLDNGSLDGFYLRSNLFLNQQAYRLGCSAEAAPGNKLHYRVRIQEQSAKLGTLRLNGRFIDRLVLSQDSAQDGFVVVLDNPGPVVKVPVGKYEQPRIWLRAGDAQAYRETANSFGEQPALVVSASSETTLVAGGPLTNSISVARQGAALMLSYRLVGVEGRPYQLANVDRNKPPGFVVTKTGKEVFSGKFEFG